MQSLEIPINPIEFYRWAATNGTQPSRYETHPPPKQRNASTDCSQVQSTTHGSANFSMIVIMLVRAMNQDQ